MAHTTRRCRAQRNMAMGEKAKHHPNNTDGAEMHVPLFRVEAMDQKAYGGGQRNRDVMRTEMTYGTIQEEVGGVIASASPPCRRHTVA